ncbi:MAG: Txe/YoeB family addiction module toxin [Desulfobacula sp.]|jgi:toxin YoeB
MKILFTQEAWKDFEWFEGRDKRLAKRIKQLLKDILRDPENGIGKPERLRFQLSGCWSRRISKEHRLVYKIEKETITVISCRYHYE